MRTLKLTLAYDGTAYVGWQRQAEGTSVQGLLEAAIARIEAQPVAVHGAGRTDAGVHALGQVASVAVPSAIPCEAYTRALNSSLPADVRVLAVEEAEADFHARFSAKAKTYRYRILQGSVASPFESRYAWHVTHALDRAAIGEALAACAGRHDFAAFQATGTPVRDTIRTIFSANIVEGVADAWLRGSGDTVRPAADLAAPPTLLVLEVTGDGFLRHMVRTLAGTLVEIGRGRWPAAAIGTILASRDRGHAGPTAPPHGLFLVEVDYRMIARSGLPA